MEIGVMKRIQIKKLEMRAQTLIQTIPLLLSDIEVKMYIEEIQSIREKIVVLRTRKVEVSAEL